MNETALEAKREPKRKKKNNKYNFPIFEYGVSVCTTRLNCM